MAKSINDWLNAYGESHKNTTNKLLHWVCVPIIMWTVIALLWCIPLAKPSWANLGVVFIALVLLFYARLSITLSLGMLAFSALSIWLIVLHLRFLDIDLWLSAFVLFSVAWLGQFIGHKVEGKKPSFFEDIQFLMIGPAWLLSFIYRRLGIPI